MFGTSFLSREVMRRVSTPPTLFILSILSLVLFGIPAYLTDKLIVLGAGAAIASFLFNSAIKLHSEARDRAFTLIRDTRDDEHMRTALNHALAFVRLNPNLTTEHVGLLHASKACRETCDHLKTATNFFEELGLAIYHREINEPLVEDWYAALLVELYDGLQPAYVAYVRQEVAKSSSPESDRLDIYHFLDYLYRRWQPRFRRQIRDQRYQ